MSEIEKILERFVRVVVREEILNERERVMKGANQVGKSVPGCEGLANPSDDPETLKAETEKEEEAKRQCPECRVMQPASRVTCDICQTRLYSPKALKAEIERELWELNKQLRDAIVAGNETTTKEVRDRIATQVGASNRAFVVDDVGYAKQAEPLGKKPPTGIPPTPAKMTHLCPCCGEKTKPGKYFLPGHGGRASGLLQRVNQKRMKKEKLAPMMRELYDVWDKSCGEKSIGECAKEIGG